MMNLEIKTTQDIINDDIDWDYASGPYPEGENKTWITMESLREYMRENNDRITIQELNKANITLKTKEKDGR